MKIVTLNIQGGFKIVQLCQEIKEKLVPFDILCLQEVCESKKIKNHAVRIAKFLGKNYSSKSFLPIDFKVKKMGNAFVFNQKAVKVLSPQGFKLPLFSPGLFWKLLTKRFCLDCDRLCQTALFQTHQGSKIRIANFHLGFVGGTATRKKQIQFVIKALSGLKKIDRELVLGDFNTIGVFRKRFSELDLLSRIGFKEVSGDIAWTASPSNPDPAWRETYWLMRLLKPFNRFLRQKTDHIFTKGKFPESECTVLFFSASDHRAVVFQSNLD